MNIDRRPTARRCALIAAALFAASSALAEDARLERAHDECAICHYVSAFALFASLADEGNCEATRIARLMLQYGRGLHATDFKVAQERLEHWQHAPGCPVVLVVR